MKPIEQRIARACSRGEFHRALQLTQAGLLTSPDSGKLWEAQGLIQYRLQDLPRAVRALEQATALEPLSTPARITLAQCYYGVGKQELGCWLLRECGRQEGLSVNERLQLAAAWDELDQPAMSVTVCRQALEEDSESAQANYDLGYYLARCRACPHMSETLMSKAIALAPGEIRYLLGLIGLLVHQHRFPAAYEKAAQLSVEQLSELCCRCCAERLCELYAQFSDTLRWAACRRVLETLT